MTNCRIIGIAALGLSLAGSASATAITDITQLFGSNLGEYGLVVNGGSHNLQLTSDSHVNGNVALGSPISLQGGGDTINGNLAFAGSANNTASVTVTGTTTTSSSSASGAVADALGLLGAYSTLTSLPQITGSTLNVSTNAGSAFNGNTNEHVYSALTSWAGALAITAAVDQYVIINVGSGASTNWSLGAISLSGGITSDHVLIDVLTTGTLSSSNAHGLAVNGVVLDNAGKVNVDNFTLNGRLFCSTASNDCQDVSGAVINSTNDSLSATPEPVSLILAGSGLLLALGYRKFVFTR